MIIKKRFVLIEHIENNINSERIISLSLGKTGYDSRETDFDTEEEAIQYAYKTNKWSNWIILPVISFKNFS